MPVPVLRLERAAARRGARGRSCRDRRWSADASCTRSSSRSSASGSMRGHGRITRRQHRRSARAAHRNQRAGAARRCRRRKRGSSARGCSAPRSAPGIVDRVFAMEAERPAGHPRAGSSSSSWTATFTFGGEDGATRDVRLRAKIDRVDLLDDGAFRVIDYKTKFVPDRRLRCSCRSTARASATRLRSSDGRDDPRQRGLYLSFEGQQSGRARSRARARSLDELIARPSSGWCRRSTTWRPGTSGAARPNPRTMCAYVSVAAPVCRNGLSAGARPMS